MGKNSKTRKARRGGTLMALALLLMGSATLRLGLEAGPAIAREVASLQDKSAGAEVPEAAGAVGGAEVLSYVWPTSLDPSAVGFEGGTGILALAATSHPDFDDTPLYDENGDGDPANDGVIWHSHWVVLTPTEACGPGALAVRDIPEGETPQLPATWPGFPIFLDSPGFSPVFDGPEIAVTAAFGRDVALEGAAYDGVTAALRVNANIHAPLLCVTDVFDVASGDLSLPGKL